MDFGICGDGEGRGPEKKYPVDTKGQLYLSVCLLSIYLFIGLTIYEICIHILLPNFA